MHVGKTASSDLYLGVGLEVNHLVLLGPFAARVRAVPHEDTIAQGGIKFCPLLYFSLCAREAADVASELQCCPFGLLTVAFNVAHGTFLGVDVRKVVVVAEASCRQWPIFVWHA